MLDWLEEEDQNRQQRALRGFKLRYKARTPLNVGSYCAACTDYVIRKSAVAP